MRRTSPMLLLLALGALGCPTDDDACHQFPVALADTFDECAESWDKTWESTPYDSRQDFIDEQQADVDHVMETMTEEEIEDYFEGCQQVWDDALEMMESCDSMVYTLYFVG